MNPPHSGVAVVVPLHNKGPHIARALGTILAQTVPPDEIIIVDDASTDDGLDQVRRFADPRIRILHREVPGPGGYAARNAGIEAAASEWIAFLDADDTWRPSAIEEARKLIALADAGTSCLFTAYDRSYGDRVTRVEGFDRICGDGPKRLNFDQFVNAWLAIGHSPMWTSAVVGRRSSLIAAGMFPAGKCNRGGDKDLWLRLMRIGDAMCSPAVTATYHRDSVNMVTKNFFTNQYPFLCGTLQQFLPTGSPESDRLIRKLINLEMYMCAREAWRADQRIDAGMYAGFNKRENPAIYGALVLMARAPRFIWRGSRALRSFLSRGNKGEKP